MRGIKTLSVLITLALLISVGGVYATWSYAGADTTGNHQHMSVNLESASTTAAEGVISEVMNTLNIKIDDLDGDYVADLVISGEMAFVFMPNTGAPADVVNNGIPMQWTLEQSATPIQYGGDDVFTITQVGPSALSSTKIEDADDVTALASKGVTASHIGGFFVEVTASDVDAYLNTTLTLPTYAEYLAFQTALNTSAGKVGITISEAPATP